MASHEDEPAGLPASPWNPDEAPATPLKAEGCASTTSSPGPSKLILESPLGVDIPKLALTPQKWALGAKGRFTPRNRPSPQSVQSRIRPSPGSRQEGRGDVALCVRLKPGCDEEVACVEGAAVRLKPMPMERGGLQSYLGEFSGRGGEADWCVCDHAFGTDASQEQVYDTAVAPIVDAVTNGYNGAVIAYGQTGAGKTYTMIGSKIGPGRGIAPRAVAGIFSGLRRASWRIEVSVLEVYNEKVRDLLAPASTVAIVDVHEVRENQGGRLTFRCPDATTWPARNAEEALAALTEGCRRREVARTDMNHHSSRSHLVFTLNVVQCDREAGATLRSRLHLVDLAGSERLKRSMVDSPSRRSGSLSARGARSPRSCQRREAGEINKSLSQLALVIQRLTAPAGLQYVPYRDSMLTRLLAESFGGSSKTCLLVCCSPGSEDREETKSSLDFGRRAKQVRNKAQINLEVDNEPSAVMKALMARELQQVQFERDAIIAARESLLVEITSLREAAASSTQQEQEARQQCVQLEEQLREAQRIATEATDAFSELREAREQLEARFAQEAEDHRLLLQASAQRVAALLEQQAKVDRSNLEVATEAVRWQESQAKAVAKLEEQMLETRGELHSQIAALERGKASLSTQHGREISELSRQIMELRGEATRLQEEKAQTARRAQEDRSALLQHWHDEVMCLRQEKAAALASAESEKLNLRRQWQAEVSNLQRTKDTALAELQQEKAALRDKWQAAMEEVSVLQAKQAALEAKYDEDLMARMAVAEDEKAELRRQCHEEVGKLLEEKAAEAAKVAVERIALQRTLDETAVAVEQEKAALLSDGEAQKAELQSRLHEASREQARHCEEKVSLMEGHSTDLAKVQETWGSAFARELHGSRSLQEKETVRLQTLVKNVTERQQASERQTALMQAELAVLQQHLETKTVEVQARRHSLPAVISRDSEGDSGSGSAPASPSDKACRTRMPDGEAETEPEGEAVLDTRKAVADFSDRTCFDMWSPSLKDLNPLEQEDTGLKQA